MKVLHVLNELRPSGAEVMLRVAAPYWSKMGVQTEILAAGDVPGAYAAILERSGYTIHHLPYSLSFAFLKSAYKFLQINEYDVIHLHAERTNFWLALIAWLARVPRVVRTIHNVFPPTKIGSGVKRCFQRKLLQSLGVVNVSIGESVKATEWKYFQNPTVCIPNWYDSDRFVWLSIEERSQIRASLKIAEDTFVIVSVGNCSQIKNHNAILHALSSIAKKINFLYLHVGQEEPEKPERKLAKDLGIANRVRFLEFVEDILPVLHAADVYIMPSLNEGFSIAALEAMAVGLPSVLADVPGLRDLKEVADELFWVKPEPPSIAETLLFLAKLPKVTRERMGWNIHASVRDRFGVERGVRAYVDLYLLDRAGEA